MLVGVSARTLVQFVGETSLWLFAIPDAAFSFIGDSQLLIVMVMLVLVVVRVLILVMFICFTAGGPLDRTLEDDKQGHHQSDLHELTLHLFFS